MKLKSFSKFSMVNVRRDDSDHYYQYHHQYSHNPWVKMIRLSNASTTTTMVAATIETFTPNTFQIMDDYDFNNDNNRQNDENIDKIFIENNVSNDSSNGQYNYEQLSIMIAISVPLLLVIISILLIFVVKSLCKLKSLISCIDEEINMENLAGKTIVITGGNQGIGAELIRQLIEFNCKCIMLCRNLELAQQLIDEIRGEHPLAQLSSYYIDLSSRASIDFCCNELLTSEQRIDYLINCASIAFLPGAQPTKSLNGHELHMAINYYGHFYLVFRLLERLKRTAEQYKTICKIVNITTILHRYGQIHFEDLNLEKSYQPFRAYAQSKLALIVAGQKMAKEFQPSNIHVYNVDPGFSFTATHYQNLYVFYQKLLKIFGWMIGFQSNEQAAANILYCLRHKRITQQSGRYYYKCKPIRPKYRIDDKLENRLWTHTLNVLDLI